MTYYPVFLKISGRKCVVVGGGQVALRKVKILLEHNADVMVISLGLCPELTQLHEDGVVRALIRKYREGDLTDAFVAIAATDSSDINRQVMVEARNRAVLVNVVDDAENSDFIVPSYLRQGDVTIAVSTAGKSPALARKIRTKLEKELGGEYAHLVGLIGETRAELKQQEITLDGDDWQSALDLDLLLDLLSRDEREKAKTTLRHNLEAKRYQVPGKRDR
ncbi:MAG: bifunctional precorrin-2 dehydrogenase/sirohydrochlorin ferrochelatase [Dehalococcoidales bacterium]|jgi:siroheme synthase-like protein|nr:siroheme synthase [Dehalococcoidales bacterium]MDP6043941.1 bifunctional precorrin-2 dehydrogenase/sirohydrochlorin ferrochelatase [Dehalococcoidales bacterium]MDP6576313.1 bifunctional precorrin-2 dehydrogenase/sirohydrochlorin ferrochelatase [Dehalococcoidales bacterium]MDP7415317.1 bifunctional precorrin-2 dehydrogenase/sirohydrochlorin ferrochelatase [Dehalococcoidales bacterium]|tara:strand:+ start:5057 stop:5716 length:660 start_codon:yes stop_codon:yes gene_type:complete